MSDSFAAAWVRRLPMRWARNSGLIGGAIGLVILAQSDAFTIWNVPVSSLFEPLFFVAILAALGFALGFWARWSLGRIAGQAVEKVPRAILSKWTIGATVLNALLVFADYSFEWRGPKFVSGTSAAAIAENGGYVIGALGSAALLGLFVGIVSCLGVKRAMRRDRERGGAAEVPLELRRPLSRRRMAATHTRTKACPKPPPSRPNRRPAR